jgi:hypothetical protein
LQETLLLSTRKSLPYNNAIHLIRHRKVICLSHHSQRPGDGERSKDLETVPDLLFKSRP